MAAEPNTAEALWRRPLRADGAVPKYARIAERIRKALREEMLRPGDRVPSVAELAELLGVNKTTVVRAYGELEREGLLVSRVGKGSFVASRAAEKPAEASHRPSGAAPRSSTSAVDGVLELLRMPAPPGAIQFGSGVPASDSVDPDCFRAAASEALSAGFDELFTYAHYGLPALREEIARWLRTRGHDVSENSILVTNGSQEALSLVANWSRARGRAVLCESPSYIGIPLAFQYFGHRVESVAREGADFVAERLTARAAGRPVTFYCCADFHNPTGTCLDESERRALARVVEANDIVLVCDDLFRDLRFAGEEPRSLYAFLPRGRRILVGSFSKSFVPGLRAGFLVADPDLLEPFAEMKRTLDLGSPTISQATAAVLLRDHYPAHLERVRARYRERRDCLIEAMERHFPEGVDFTRPDGGFQLWARMPEGCSSVHLYLRALARGVQISPGPAHDIAGGYLNGFRLSVSQASCEDIERGVPILAEVVREVMEGAPDAAAPAGPGFPL